jgi:uncharacterized phiE125 gp8 family phage protein
MQTIAPEITTAPTAEPLTLSEAKKQLELASSDTSHDEHLSSLIQSAREEWERDTETLLCTQTVRIKTSDIFDGFKLPHQPVQSVASLVYFDSNNVSQTLATSIWDFDSARRQIRLKYNQLFPVWTPRYDAWTITYVCGYSDDGKLVPAIAKQAMLLLVGYYFDANRGENDRAHDKRCYELLVNKHMRESYP